MSAATPGPDGRLRCPWALSAPDYLDYHDEEWGRPLDVQGPEADRALFERLTLEAFQSGLSWLIILRKRPAFRQAFDGFEISRVAAFGPNDVERLLGDAGIVRNRAKIEAAVTNARAAAGLEEGLAAHVRSFAPAVAAPAPVSLADLASQTPQSQALARDLRKRGFRFVGPTTLHALMQATGIVNDHLAGCWRR
ncbi:MAG: DNA-3-methyladenine glycosylase [Frankiaceae bacterium]|nr:DNA-3-methyladenine glycosylase [Frankiaceae bacterium]